MWNGRRTITIVLSSAGFRPSCSGAQPLCSGLPGACAGLPVHELEFAMGAEGSGQPQHSMLHVRG